MIRTLQWARAIGWVAGGGLTAVFAPNLTTPERVGLGIMGAAGLLGQLLPASKVAADAPIVDNVGRKIGTNVSTTSTAPILAPTAGQGNNTGIMSPDVTEAAQRVENGQKP